MPQDFYRVVDRRKEMIKYKGFPVAPAEVESVLLEHPAVRDCGVVGRADADRRRNPGRLRGFAGRFASGTKLADELCGYVADRLTPYKQPREVRFVEGVPNAFRKDPAPRAPQSLRLIPVTVEPLYRSRPGTVPSLHPRRPRMLHSLRHADGHPSSL